MRGLCWFLRGDPVRGHVRAARHRLVPFITPTALQEAAGSLGTLNHKQHYVVLTFPMDEGTAIISGNLESGRLEDGRMFLLESGRR
jgi:hypothetical protein